MQMVSGLDNECYISLQNYNKVVIKWIIHINGMANYQRKQEDIDEDKALHILESLH